MHHLFVLLFSLAVWVGFTLFFLCNAITNPIYGIIIAWINTVSCGTAYMRLRWFEKHCEVSKETSETKRNLGIVLAVLSLTTLIPVISYWSASPLQISFILLLSVFMIVEGARVAQGKKTFLS